MRRFAISRFTHSRKSIARCLAASSLAVALLSIAGRAAADCPQSTIFIGGLDPAIPIPKLAPRCDTTFSIQPCDRVHGRYDLFAGLLVASIDFACPDTPGFPGPSGLETVFEDDFHLVGRDSGLPVLFTAVLHLTGEGHKFGAPGFTNSGARVRGNGSGAQDQLGPAQVQLPLSGPPRRLRRYPR